MLVVMPDARHAGPAEIEQNVFGQRAEIRAYQAGSQADIPPEVWTGADALMIWGGLHCDKEMLERVPNCKIVIRMGVGFDAIDIEEAGKRGIPACNVPDYGTTDVADHAIGLMLCLTRGIVKNHNALVKDPVGNWKSIDIPMMRRIRGSTFGVIGCGRIGTAAGLRAKALGMNVIFFDPFVEDGKDQSVGFQRRSTLEELLSEADIISIHVPLTNETTNLINEQTISSMKRDAILITTARGKVVDLDAITAALKSNRIAAAAFDVLPEEPPDPEHALFTALKNGEEWTIGRVIVTPHVAWYTPDGVDSAREKAAQTVIRFLTEGILKNCVNGHFLKTGL